jgi:hypothetical protein
MPLAFSRKAVTAAGRRALGRCRGLQDARVGAFHSLVGADPGKAVPSSGRRRRGTGVEVLHGR